MPTYEYRCPKGHQFEHFFRSISAAEGPMKCPQCGEVAEKQISGGTGLLFKGSGFYITDYGKDGKKDQRRNAPGSSDSPGSGGASSSGSESSKPAETKPAKGSGSSDA